MTGRGGDGFVLVEALAAFAIAALALIALFAALASATRGDGRAAFERAAVRVAMSRLDALGAELLVEGSSGGEAPGGLRWTLTLAPYRPGERSAFWARVEVRGPGESARVLALTSLKLQRGAP